MCKAKEFQDRIDALPKEIAEATSRAACTLHIHAILQSQSEITVLVSQLAEISTRRIVRLAWRLFWLTVGLLLVSIITLVIIL
jgi:hypothetical protein